MKHFAATACGGNFILVLLVLLCSCSEQVASTAPLPPVESVQGPDLVKDSEYRIQAGDVLRVRYLYHPELNVKVPVRPDGDISLQVAGVIHAGDLTTTELERVIEKRSSHRLREPEISVIVAEAERKVYVGGEVRIPGFVKYKKGLTPLQAIMDRGGFTTVARVDSVLRLSPAKGQYQGTRMDFTKPLSDGTPEGVELLAGDVVFVPRTFIGDVNLFVSQYIRGVLPIEPRIGAGTSF
jgi:protein involved in polysaccharide export with SLBB domain